MLNSIIIQTYDIENQLDYDINSTTNTNSTRKKNGRIYGLVTYFKSVLVYPKIGVSNNK
jgi:hypothetical protein